MSLTYSYAVIQLHDRKDRLWPNPVLSNLEVSPIHLSRSGRRGTQSGQAGETCYKLARALSISDHQIRRQ
jgi:hypothetical protein